jgi:hypothetical protein
VRDLTSDIEQLRRHRVPGEPNLSIGSLVAEQARYAQRTRAQLGQMIDLWFQLVPTELRNHTAICALKRGVLTVDVDSASVRFELDRRLREGLIDQLRQHFRGTLRQVKIRLASN